MLVALGFNYYSSVLILKAHNRFSDTRSYGQLATKLLGEGWGWFLNIVLTFERILVCVLYLSTARDSIWTGLYQIASIQKGELAIKTAITIVLTLVVLALLPLRRLERVKKVSVAAFLSLALFVVSLGIQMKDRQAQERGLKINYWIWPDMDIFTLLSSAFFTFAHQDTLLFIMSLFQNEVKFRYKISVTLIRPSGGPWQWLLSSRSPSPSSATCPSARTSRKTSPSSTASASRPTTSCSSPRSSSESRTPC